MFCPLDSCVTQAPEMASAFIQYLCKLQRLFWEQKEASSHLPAHLNILTARLESHISLCAAFFCLRSGCSGVQTGSYLTSQRSNKLFHIIFASAY